MRQLLKITTTFALALVLTAGMAFGQAEQSTTVDQSGDRNDATVEQMTQTNESDVYINQSGSRNVGNITQQYGQFHDADLNQSGSRNYAELVQDNTNTTADLDQEGSRNVIDADQRNYEFTFGYAGTAYLDIYQSGDRNNASVSQDGRGQMTGIVSQNGSRNYVELSQMTPGGEGVSESVSNYANFDQNGFKNDAFVTQSGDKINEAWVNQSGSHNSVSITQGDLAD